MSSVSVYNTKYLCEIGTDVPTCGNQRDSSGGSGGVAPGGTPCPTVFIIIASVAYVPLRVIRSTTCCSVNICAARRYVASLTLWVVEISMHKS